MNLRGTFSKSLIGISLLASIFAFQNCAQQGAFEASSTVDISDAALVNEGKAVANQIYDSETRAKMEGDRAEFKNVFRTMAIEKFKGTSNEEIKATVDQMIDAGASPADLEVSFSARADLKMAVERLAKIQQNRAGLISSLGITPYSIRFSLILNKKISAIELQTALRKDVSPRISIAQNSNEELDLAQGFINGNKEHVNDLNAAFVQLSRHPLVKAIANDVSIKSSEGSPTKTPEQSDVVHVPAQEWQIVTARIKPNPNHTRTSEHLLRIVQETAKNKYVAVVGQWGKEHYLFSFRVKVEKSAVDELMRTLRASTQFELLGLTHRFVMKQYRITVNEHADCLKLKDLCNGKYFKPEKIEADVVPSLHTTWPQGLPIVNPNFWLTKIENERSFIFTLVNEGAMSYYSDMSKLGKALGMLSYVDTIRPIGTTEGYTKGSTAAYLSATTYITLAIKYKKDQFTLCQDSAVAKVHYCYPDGYLKLEFVLEALNAGFAKTIIFPSGSIREGATNIYVKFPNDPLSKSELIKALKIAPFIESVTEVK
ncbi:hypothetical protein [Bdellovibrio reynosensis]|uniref:SPOR domain-containing protein n=1 Tax=Bdellovibrio reynosensis TaxID=2835041 RepID=A0ABY4CCR3_9BACT|nr:hypothetical protein [Bdellovibrio reynosensis]UOF02628.1 hypothetical protein MNR06_06655 [Bdellovibrio reynosensis]